MMILAVCQQLVGLAIINTYSTCTLPDSPVACCFRQSLTVYVDFFSLAGLADPFLGSLILS